MTDICRPESLLDQAVELPNRSCVIDLKDDAVVQRVAATLRRKRVNPCPHTARYPDEPGG